MATPSSYVLRCRGSQCFIIPSKLSSAAALKYHDTIFFSHNADLSTPDVFHCINSLRISNGTGRKKTKYLKASAASAGSHHPIPANWWEQFLKSKSPNPPCLSEILWPSAGAFVSMAAMGLVDQILAPRGLTLTIAPFGAVCVLLFAAPNADASQKYNVMIAHMGCALIGVLALAVLGSGWMARSVALASSVAFMLCTHSFHPPAAGLPLLFIDAPKFHHLKWWYTFFPGAIGCLLLFLVQAGVEILKEKYQF
ncbi:hypothetical protein O6H91_20G004900 [Diphasiastrum complanatum]|uniref:Uncharacterized protein n=1 Tax=Diphasiastrum complanatum TaxID=34168 RepID=A0ACC2AML8_DIPCM|nr:hypothetical protein O6H91_20G004900 [Diphasiastrum complanatum]